MICEGREEGSRRVTSKLEVSFYIKWRAEDGEEEKGAELEGVLYSTLQLKNAELLLSCLDYISLLV